jgi:hypothetical protein
MMMDFDTIEIFKDKSSPLLVAGPCSAESREQVLTAAAGVAAAGIKTFRAGVWKPRTKPGSFEGIGPEALEWLREAKERYGVKVVTEVATPEHLEEALKMGIDGVWVGARTTTNPFAMQQIADALRGVDTAVLTVKSSGNGAAQQNEIEGTVRSDGTNHQTEGIHMTGAHDGLAAVTSGDGDDAAALLDGGKTVAKLLCLAADVSDDIAAVAGGAIDGKQLFGGGEKFFSVKIDIHGVTSFLCYRMPLASSASLIARRRPRSVSQCLRGWV